MLNAASANAAPGDLDPSFSRDGKLRINHNIADGSVLAVAQLPDEDRRRSRDRGVFGSAPSFGDTDSGGFDLEEFNQPFTFVIP